MGLSLMHIFEALLMIANAFAILNEQRFLKPRGWHNPIINNPEVTGVNYLKNQVIFLLYAARSYGRYILIILNTLAIIVEVLFG